MIEQKAQAILDERLIHGGGLPKPKRRPLESHPPASPPAKTLTPRVNLNSLP
jgi:hypothetical protein